MMYFQKELEEKAFKIGGGDFKAPAQRVEDFLQRKVTTKFGAVTPTYLPGVTMADLHDILPKFITDVMEEGLLYFDKKINSKIIKTKVYITLKRHKR